MSREIALACADRGWKVFPVSVVYKSGGKTDKRPLVPWTTEATSNPDEVLRLWRLHAHAKVGVVTGAVSDLYVVDVDDPSAADQLSGAPGRVVYTNRPGGYHLYYSGPTDGLPVRNSQDGGIDVRGDGGMVVCWHGPPEGDLAPLPNEIAEWARTRTTSVERDGPRVVPEVIRWPGGGSDAWVVSMVGSMCRRGFREEAALAAMITENDLGRFDPPCDVEWLAEKVSGVYARYFDPSRSTSPALLDALAKLKERN